MKIKFRTVIFLFSLTVNLIICIFGFLELKKWFLKTDLYYQLSGQCISLENIMSTKENQGFFDLAELGEEGTGLRLHYVDPSIKRITGSNYLTKFQEVNALYYDLVDMPPKFYQILNQMPNLKELIVDQPMRTDYMADLKNLKYVEKFDFTTAKIKNLGNILDTYEKLRELKLKCEFNHSDDEFNIFNTTLEKFDMEINVEEKSLVEDNLKLVLNTPNLKELQLESRGYESYTRAPLSIIFKNKGMDSIDFDPEDAKKIEIESIFLNGIRAPKIDSLYEPILLKQLTILTPHLIEIDLEDFLKSITVNTLEKFILIDETLKINNIEFIENLKNTTELALHNRSMTDLTGIKEMEQLETLYLGSENLENIDGIEALKNLKSLDLYAKNIKDYSELKNLNNLTELKISYSELDKLPDLENLKSLILIIEPMDNDKRKQPVELNGRFKNAEVSLEYPTFYNAYIYSPIF